MGHPLRPARGVGDGHRSDEQGRDQGDGLLADLVNDSAEVAKVRLKREVADVAVGQAAAAVVVAYQVDSLDVALVPATILGDLPLQLDMTERHVRQDYRWDSLTHRPVGDADAVLGLGVLDARLHSGAIVTAQTISK